MSNDTAAVWTINAIQAAMRARGSHWWDPDTMQCFGTVVASPVYEGPGGIFFVTEDRRFDNSRGHTVRQFLSVTQEVTTIDNVAQYDLKEAKRLAKRMAAAHLPIAQVTEHKERHRPVSVLDQFVQDCQRHGNPQALPAHCHLLIKAATVHHRFMEGQCNGEWPYRDHNLDDGHPTIVEQCRRKIKSLASQVGAHRVLFSGDPRSCTVKLVFHDGYCNDFAKEGYCVPVEER